MHWFIVNLPTSTSLLVQISNTLAHVLRVVIFVSTFVAWVWVCIKKFDKGEGVRLSASWILPLVLIPSARGGSDMRAE